MELNKEEMMNVSSALAQYDNYLEEKLEEEKEEIDFYERRLQNRRDRYTPERIHNMENLVAEHKQALAMYEAEAKSTKELHRKIKQHLISQYTESLS